MEGSPPADAGSLLYAREGGSQRRIEKGLLAAGVDALELGVQPGRVDLADDLDAVDQDAVVDQADADFAVDGLRAVAVELALVHGELHPGPFAAERRHVRGVLRQLDAGAAL